MIIKYLGTAAAEGVPAIFCNCLSCTNARKNKGKDIRTRSQLMFNDDLLIDFPMDTYLHMLKYNLDLSKIKNIFITHAHMDHLYPMEFTLRGYPYAHNMTEKVVNIYGNETVINTFSTQVEPQLSNEARESFKLNILHPYNTISANDYLVTTLPAVHTANEECLVYLIQSEGKSVLVLNDTGILLDEVYDFLKGKKLDLVSYDCTYGNTKKGSGRHMGMLDAANERQKMKDLNLIDKNTIHILTHFSHNGCLPYKQMLKEAKPYDFLVAYDGMSIKL